MEPQIFRFDELYKNLNAAQKKAVDAIDGPVLVIAGPGSGKTEILSLRVGNILKRTDIPAGSILCLTFTDSAAMNMRNRLTTIIGRDAYRVAIYTFHSFCVDVINRHPEFFYGGASFTPADALVQIEVLERILESLPYDNPLRSVHPEQGFVYLSDIRRGVSDLKKAGIRPDEFKKILLHNQEVEAYINPLIKEIFKERITKESIKEAQALCEKISKKKFKEFPVPHMKPIFPVFCESLNRSVKRSEEENSSKPITLWKNAWIKKNDDGENVLKDTLNQEKYFALAEIYERYTKEMHEQGYYDFDDMILDVISQIEKRPSLRFELQEQFQYILVDEFQDTNDAQMRLLRNLTDAEVNEGRPNIMAVGDDDQAVYKFQGAEISNILDFKNMYKDPEIITLSHNYRSTQKILDLASFIIQKGEERLSKIIPELEKTLIAANKNIKEGNIRNKIFPTKAHEFSWVAKEAKRLIDEGKDPKDIAVITRKHRELEALVPYFQTQGVPINYERQQNVFFEPHIRELVIMARFIDSLSKKNKEEADEFLPQILSFKFWKLKREDIWNISIKAHKQEKFWLEVMLESSNKKLKVLAEFFLELAGKAASEPVEIVLDDMIGAHVPLLAENEEENDEVPFEDDTKDEKTFHSPFKDFYFSNERFKHQRAEYLSFLSSLRVFIQALKEFKQGEVLLLPDLIAFVDLHEKNEIPLNDQSPFVNAKDSVNLLTAHKAKGLEFDTVFVLSCQEEVWARGGRGMKLSFPLNLQISPAGDTVDDNLRLFFVALTRAKHNLYITSHEISESGKESARLQFLITEENEDQKTILEILRGEKVEDPELPKTHDVLTASWLRFHTPPFLGEEEALLKSLVKDYKMSVTHLNNFLNVAKGGPQAFLEQNLLRFPQSKTPSGAYGSAMHKALECLAIEFKRKEKLPKLEEFLTDFEKALRREHLASADFKMMLERGKNALTIFYKQKKDLFNAEDLVEVNFVHQGVAVGDAHLTGKIDKISKEGGELIVHDFKTGKAPLSWEGKSLYEKIKLHEYRRQIIFYKLLVENSREYGDKYKVRQGILEFLEPTQKGTIIDLPLDIASSETKRLEQLIKVVYEKIINLDFPDVSKYPVTVDGIEKFEEDLLTN